MSATSEKTDDVPMAEVKTAAWSVGDVFGKRFTWFWLVTAASVLIALATVVASWWVRGPEVVVQFAHGHNIQPGDRLRHRGIEVGEVTSVTLANDFRGVEIRVALEPSATGLARKGSQFWIERPQVSLRRVSGLETIVGGQYIAVLPGDADAEPQWQFDGLEAPPVGELAPGGLEIRLEADQLGGLYPRAPITYRGVQVGRVISVGLATDAATVTAHAFIEPAYANLVCDKSRFWRKSGIDLTVGFTGVQLDMESLSSVTIGGISFATEDPPGKPVKTGHTFDLHPKPEDEWLTWRPRLHVGSALLPDGLSLPQPVRSSLRWRERKFGINRNRQIQGWVLPLEGTRLLGPASLLAPTVGEEKDATLEIAGHELAIPANPDGTLAQRRDTGSPLAMIETGIRLEKVNPWPVARIRVPGEPEDCLIVAATDTSVLPVPSGRIADEAGKWQLDDSLNLSATDHHGACAVAVRDGRLIGVIVIADDRAQVSIVTPQLIALLREP